MPTDTTVNLNWEGADDDTGVTNYRIYQDGVMLTTLPDISFFLVGSLSPETEYSFKVEAGDADGNWSVDGPAVTVSTEAEDPGSTIAIYSFQCLECRKRFYSKCPQNTKTACPFCFSYEIK